MNGRILVVEDSAPGARLWVELAALAGREAEVARTGSEALLSVEAEPPALVVMDLRLPDGDGVAWARRLKGCAGMASVPVWACSGLSAEDLLDAAWDEAPFAAFIAKPFSAAEVLARLRAVLA